MLAEGVHVFRAPRFVILDVMRFVDDQHVEREVVLQLQIARRFEVCHGHTAALLPFAERAHAPRAVNLDRTQAAFLPDFLAPVGQNAGRAHHHEARRAGISQGNHRRNRLHRLSQTHFVAQQHALLMQDVLYAPFLIPAQLAPQPLREEALVLNLPRQLLRKTVARIVVSEYAGHERFQHIVVGDAVSGKVLPRRFRVRVPQRRQPLRARFDGLRIRARLKPRQIPLVLDAFLPFGDVHKRPRNTVSNGLKRFHRALGLSLLRARRFVQRVDDCASPPVIADCRDQPCRVRRPIVRRKPDFRVRCDPLGIFPRAFLDQPRAFLADAAHAFKLRLRRAIHVRHRLIAVVAQRLEANA